MCARTACAVGADPAQKPTFRPSPSPSSRRTWKPNTQSKLLFSAALGASVRLTVTASALRTIDRAGGLDAYLLATPPGRLDSDAGEELRARVVAALRARREAGQVAAPGPAAEGA